MLTFRTLPALLLLATAATGTALARDLTFEERVAAQEAIERVYYSHQIGATKPFKDAVPREVLEGKVGKYLQQTAVLEAYWKTPVTDEALQRELERMARGTRLPDRLRELFAALDEDPFVIKECLARATLVDRLTRNFYAFDPTLHAGARQRAEEIHRQLEVRELDPWSDHPDRTVIELVERDAKGGAPRARERQDGLLEEGRPNRRLLSPEEFRKERARWPEAPGRVAPLAEEREAFVIRVTLSDAPGESRVASYVVRKQEWDLWWETVKEDLLDEQVSAVALDGGSLPIAVNSLAAVTTTADPSAGAVPDLMTGESLASTADDTWDNGILDDLPEPRFLHTAVWTGIVMVVWGGYGNTGGRYDPATDTWTPTSTVGAPSARGLHTAVWTGSVMVIWGGYSNTGGRYDPATDTWTPTSTVGAPSARYFHTAVWTGSLMVVWGGYGSTYFNTGGRYNPATDTWTPTSTVGAPSSRWTHKAVWTGRLMVIWGGYDTVSQDPLNTGGRYDPATDTWMPTSIVGAPSARSLHTAIWTGTLMVVWGGYNGSITLNTGARYNPVTDTWTPTSAMGAPSERDNHSAVWTGTVMVVWGGYGGSSCLNSGGRYDPAANIWAPTSTVGAPSGRRTHTAIWTGSLMVVWGGENHSYDGHYYYFNTGGRYDPATNSWTATSIVGGPSERKDHTAVWTGTVMVVWGGYADRTLNTGGRYDPATDTWTATSTVGAPSARWEHTAIWTGTLMVVWGGYADRTLNTGGRYDPATDTWTATSTVGALSARYGHTAVWTGSLMVVWGGASAKNAYYVLNTGGRYDPATDTWTATSAVGVPSARAFHTAVWTGSVIVVWGGYNGSSYPNTGGRYNPATDSWTLTSTVGAPSARAFHAAVWTGTVMAVWGGFGGSIYPTYLNTGGRYNPATDSWTATSLVGAPSARRDHTAVWTGSLMVVWGGFGAGYYLNTGGRYDPAADTWVATSTVGAPSARAYHTTVWTGSMMVVWGGERGYEGSNYINTGGRYVLITNAPPVADAGPDQTLECTGGGQATAVLDGSGSSDPDSTPGTHDDIVSFKWSEGAEQLATGELVSVPFPLGAHLVTLAVTDKAGAGSTDDTLVTVQDTTPPALFCPPDVTVECQSAGQAEVLVPPATASDSCYGPVPVTNDRTPGGADASGAYPLGSTTITFTATDGAGNTSSCETVVTVVDTTPPLISSSVSPDLLWPPNHRMVGVSASVVATDACSTPTVILASVTSSEPDDAPWEGDGTTPYDIQGAEIGTADFEFLLRAERDATEEGRVYQVTYGAIDGSGNSASAVSFVLVPRDVGKGFEHQWKWYNGHRINP